MTETNTVDFLALNVLDASRREAPGPAGQTLGRFIAACAMLFAAAANAAAPAAHPPTPISAPSAIAPQPGAAANTAASVPVAAATPRPADAPADAQCQDELCALEREKMVLTAKLAVAKLKSDIRKLELSDSPSPVSTPPAASSLPALMGEASAADISFVGSASYGGVATATLSIGGSSRDVGVGDLVTEGWRVGQITPIAVELTRGKQHRWIRQ